ncbi:hypothetical protein CRG98_020493, partial [Punica granatum]
MEFRGSGEVHTTRVHLSSTRSEYLLRASRLGGSDSWTGTARRTQFQYYPRIFAPPSHHSGSSRVFTDIGAGASSKRGACAEAIGSRRQPVVGSRDVPRSCRIVSCSSSPERN